MAVQITEDRARNTIQLMKEVQVILGQKDSLTARVASQLEVVDVSDTTLKMMATDGVRLYVNGGWVWSTVKGGVGLKDLVQITETVMADHLTFARPLGF